MSVVVSGRNRAGVVLQLLQEHALRGDLRLDLPVGAAGDADGDRQRGAMPRQPHDAHVMAEILAAELRADAEVLGQLVDLGLQRGVADGVAGPVAGGRQPVEVAGGGQLHRLQRRLGGGAADDDGQVVGRAGAGPERLHLLLDEGQQLRLVQHRAGLLVEEGLVGRPAALEHEHQVQLVGMVLAGGGHDGEVDRQVVAGVDLLEHRQRRHLRIAQVGLGIGAGDAVASAPPPRRPRPRRAGPSCRRRWRCRCPGTSAACRRRRWRRSSAGRARRSGRSR